MTSAGVDDLAYRAFEVRGGVCQDGRPGLALRERFTVEQAVLLSVGRKNRAASDSWSAPRTCTAATRLSAKHLNTLLPGWIAVMMNGGRKEACATHVTVATRSGLHFATSPCTCCC